MKKKKRQNHVIINNYSYAAHDLLLDNFKAMIGYHQEQLAMYEDIIREATGTQRKDEYKYFITYCETLAHYLDGMLSLLYQSYIINNRQYDIYKNRINKKIRFFYDRIGFELGL